MYRHTSSHNTGLEGFVRGVVGYAGGGLYGEQDWDGCHPVSSATQPRGCMCRHTGSNNTPRPHTPSDVL
jgi:hypothetical protein